MLQEGILGIELIIPSQKPARIAGYALTLTQSLDYIGIGTDEIISTLT